MLFGGLFFTATMRCSLVGLLSGGGGGVNEGVYKLTVLRDNFVYCIPLGVRSVASG